MFVSTVEVLLPRHLVLGWRPASGEATWIATRGARQSLALPAATQALDQVTILARSVTSSMLEMTWEGGMEQKRQASYIGLGLMGGGRPHIY